MTMNNGNNGHDDTGPVQPNLHMPNPLTEVKVCQSMIRSYTLWAYWAGMSKEAIIASLEAELTLWREV